MLTRVVLAVSSAPLRRQLRGLLNKPDILLEIEATGSGLWDRVVRKTADMLVISEGAVRGPLAQKIAALGELPDPPGVIVISASDDPVNRACLTASGCLAVLHEGLSAEVFGEVLQALLARRAAAARSTLLADGDMSTPRLSDFVSESPCMQVFMGLARRVVRSDVSLLILGETGVGKERLARAIHGEGPRSEGPFVAINCAALPESLLESELFGHERGAFTGAARTRRGWFELAHRGTVFLDEIGELPYHVQVKLLRVLQDRQVQPVGGERTIPVDVRLMAASNRDLESEVSEGRFRRDLYYRLSVVTLTIPPLRERREDIPVLVESYMDYLQPRVGCAAEGITDQALDALIQYSWPGNVRELINVIERALLLCDGGMIGPADLPETVRGGAGPVGDEPGSAPGGPIVGDLPEEWLRMPWRRVRERFLADLEKGYIEGLLAATGGRVGQTAKRAGLSPRALYDKMKRHDLCKEDYKT